MFIDIDIPDVIIPTKVPLEGSNYKYSCSISAYPTVLHNNWIWEHNGKPISRGHILPLTTLSPRESGKYECIAKNEAGTVKNSTTLEVACM